MIIVGIEVRKGSFVPEDSKDGKEISYDNVMVFCESGKLDRRSGKNEIFGKWTCSYKLKRSELVECLGTSKFQDMIGMDVLPEYNDYNKICGLFVRAVR